MNLLTANVHVVEHGRYEDFLKEALDIAPHPEDAPYLALALHLRIPIWSNDKGIAKQQIVGVNTTRTLLEKLAE